MKLLKSRKNLEKIPVRRSANNIQPKSQQPFSYYRSFRSTGEAVKPIATRGSRLWSVSSTIRERRLWRFVPELLTIGLVIVSVLYTGLLKPVPTIIASQEPSLDTYRQPSEYMRVAEEYLRSSPANKLKLLVDSSKMASKIRATFPEIGSIEVSVPVFGQRPVLYMSLYHPIFRLSAPNGTYILMSNGFLSSIGDGAKVADLPLLTDLSGLEAKPGSAVLTPEQVRFITRLQKQMEALKITPVNYTIPAVPYEIDLQQPGKGYRIKFGLQGDADVQSGAVAAALKGLTGENEPKEYIDARVEDKLFYK